MRNAKQDKSWRYSDTGPHNPSDYGQRHRLTGITERVGHMNIPGADVIATRFGLNPRLVVAQIVVESGGDRYAWNPEPHYVYLWNVKTHAQFRPLTPAEITAEQPPPDFPTLVGDRDQEWWAQQASWGLMQVMGALARELGFSEKYLTALTDPEKNMSVGCLQMARLMAWAEGNTVQALAAYNGGKTGNIAPPYRNQAYASKVMAQLGRDA